MSVATGGETSAVVPKRRQKHYSFDESVDEPAKLIEDEPMEIEEERPAEENRPVEGAEEDEKSNLPAFEE